MLAGFGLDDQQALRADWDAGRRLPSVIDRRGKPRSMGSIPDPGARLRSLCLEHPHPAAIAALYRELAVDRPPAVVQGDDARYRARIEMPDGVKELF